MQNRRDDVVSKRETAFVYVSTTSPAEAKQWIQDISAQGNNPNYLGTFRSARAKHRGSRSEEEYVKYLLFYFAANIVKGRVLILDVDLSLERYLSVELLLTRLGGARGPRVGIEKIGSALASCVATPEGEKLVYPEYENKFEPAGHKLFRRELIRAIAQDCTNKQLVCVHISRLKDIVEWSAAFNGRRSQFFGNCEPLLHLRASFPKTGDDDEAVWMRRGETEGYASRDEYVRDAIRGDDKATFYPADFENVLAPEESPLLTAIIIAHLVIVQGGTRKDGVVMNVDASSFDVMTALTLAHIGFAVHFVDKQGQDAVKRVIEDKYFESQRARWSNSALERRKGKRWPRFERLLESTPNSFVVSSDDKASGWMEGMIIVTPQAPSSQSFVLIPKLYRTQFITNNYIQQTGGRYIQGKTFFATSKSGLDGDVTNPKNLLEVVATAVGYNIKMNELSEALLYPLQTYLHFLGQPPKGTHYIIDHAYFLLLHQRWTKNAFHVHRKQEPVHPVKLASIFNAKGVTFHILCHSSSNGRDVISEETRNSRSSVADKRTYHAVRSVDLIRNWDHGGKIIPVAGETSLEFVIRKLRFEAIQPAVQQHVSYKSHILVLTPGDPKREQTIFDPLSIHAKAYGVFLNDSINGLTMATKFARGRFIQAIFGDRVGTRGRVKSTMKQRFYGNTFFPEVADIELIGAAEFEVRLKLVNGTSVDVLVSGHMFNNLFGSDIDLVDIESYLKQIESNVMATKPGKVVPLENALESTDSGRTSLWHNYYDYQLACVMYMHLCFIKAFTDSKRQIPSSILLAIYASKRLKRIRANYPWFVGKTIASLDPRGLKPLNQPSDVIVA